MALRKEVKTAYRIKELELQARLEVKDLFRPTIDRKSAEIDPGSELRQRRGTHQLLYDHSRERSLRAEQMKILSSEMTMNDCNFDMVHTLPKYPLLTQKPEIVRVDAQTIRKYYQVSEWRPGL